MQVSVVSPVLIGLIVGATIALGLATGAARQILFIALNLTFLCVQILGVREILITICFIAAGYLLVLAARTSPKWVLRLGLPAFVILFVYLKNYAFLSWVLPSNTLPSSLSTIGLSFLFFKILHVVIDARSNTLGAFDALTYVGYCTNFTTFVMGPISRYQDHRAQWSNTDFELSFEGHLDAIIRILVGLFKAQVLAEWLLPYSIAGSQIATSIFSVNSLPPMQSRSELLFAIYAYNIYLYLNFSGYCDVMIGAGTLFGVCPPENFNKPFMARNVSEYWQRHHRSLTLWLTDYVYTPVLKGFLESDRFGRYPLLVISLSLVITMLVSGMWHGTSFGFLMFGLLHGFYLVAYRTWDAFVTRKFGKKQVREWRSRLWVQAVSIAMTFNAVSFALIFFQLGIRGGLMVLTRLFSL
jgi:membrane protein involved in D-alanine export